MTQIDSEPKVQASSSGNSTQDDPLAHLYKMSPTAGVATTDYASINNLSIFAILLGVASILCVVFFSGFLLVIPLAGIVCSIIAIRQVRQSNGTQVGLTLALAGLLLSIGLGGSVLGYGLYQGAQVRAKEQQIATLMQQVGDLISKGKYDEVYEKTSPRFRQRIPRDNFIRQLSGFNASPLTGHLLSIEWNQVPMIFEINPDSHEQIATALGLEKVEKYAQPTSDEFIFSNSGSGWQIEGMPRLFPSKTTSSSEQNSQQPNAAGPGAPSDPTSPVQ